MGEDPRDPVLAVLPPSLLPFDRSVCTLIVGERLLIELGIHRFQLPVGAVAEDQPIRHVGAELGQQ